MKRNTYKNACPMALTLNSIEIEYSTYRKFKRQVEFLNMRYTYKGIIYTRIKDLHL